MTPNSVWLWPLAPVHFPPSVPQSALQGQGTFRRHILCPSGNVLEQRVPLPYHPERSMGKQWDEGRCVWRGARKKVEGREGRGSYCQDRELAEIRLLGRALPLQATGSMFGT